MAAAALGIGAAPALAASAGPATSVSLATPASPTAPALPTGCSQSGVTVTCTYTSTGEHQFGVPAGVTSVTATVVGGQGGADFGASTSGGLGAVATGTLSVTPGQAIFAEVGILGGAAGQLFPGFSDSGAGGGESDVRLCPSAGGQPCASGSTLASRLIVAGGGGGSGDFGGLPGAAGTPTPGGDGAAPTSSGAHNATPGNGATSTAPGAGGAGCDGGGAGSPGAAAGGAGGNAGPANGVDGVSGGGGGAGWFGGGAGGGCSNANDDAGSGGGGSSHAASSVTGVSFSQAAAGQAPSVSISYTALTVTTSVLPSGTVGEAYSTTLAAAGGTTPLTWSLSGGSLPDGLSISTGGTISGTPQAAGTFNFTVQVADSGSPQQTATQAFSIEIGKAAPAVTLSAAPTSGATAANSISLTANVSGSNGAPAATGTVEFDVNGTAVSGCADVTVTSGSATCPAGTLPSGTYTLKAIYSGDTNFLSGSDTISNYQVQQANATMELSASPDFNATVATPVALTANLSGPAGAPTPTGTVTFNVDGAVPSGCASVKISSGVATCDAGDLSQGFHNFTADYSGDSSYGTTNAGIFLYPVAQATPTVALSASPSGGATVADPVSLTANVSVPAGAPDPTGTVDFTVDGQTVQGCGSVTVTSGAATCAVGNLPAGTHELKAGYSGDTNYLPADDAITGYQVPQATAGVSLSATPAGGALVTDSVGLSATVVPVMGGPAPTGTVTFLVDGTAPAGCTNVSLASGSATCSVGKLAAGTQTFEADYSGDTNYVATSDTVGNYTVSKLTSRLAVSSSLPTAVWGQPVSFTATVTVSPAGTPVSGGTVQWSVNGTPVGSPVPVGADGTVPLGPLTNLLVGADDMTGTYSGTDQIAPTRADEMFVVGKASTTATIAVTSKRLTATVTPQAPGAGQPAGPVTFTVNGTMVGTANLSATGVATLAFKSSGAEVAAASYSGDDHFTGSTASTSTTNPVITAKITSAHPKTKFGWYRSAVTITFSCKAGSAPLKTPCPHPVTLGKSAAAQSVSRTISDTDGGIAMITVSPINIDLKAPVVKVAGIKNGGTYNAPGPAKITCQASDSLSGLASPCVLKVVRGPLHLTWTARATDQAGNTTTVGGKASLTDFFVAGVPKVNGFYQVKVGGSYMVEAFVVTTKAPRYVFAAPLGVQPHPVGPAMTKIGTDLWAIQINITHQMSKHKFWTLGVKVGAALHLIHIQLHD